MRQEGFCRHGQWAGSLLLQEWRTLGGGLKGGARVSKLGSGSTKEMLPKPQAFSVPPHTHPTPAPVLKGS